jgi:hypothetical protein
MSTALVVGDNTTFQVTCQDVDGDAIDLTNATVTFRYWLNDHDAAEETATVTDAANGIATVTMPDANPSTMVGVYERGTFEYEWHINDTGTSDEFTSVVTFSRTVRDRIPTP